MLVSTSSSGVATNLASNANLAAKGVNIQGTIYANGNLNLGYGQTFTINGVNGASLNLGSGTLTATGNVTFANMNITSLSQNGARFTQITRLS